MAHVRRHPKSGRWQVRYRDLDGRERSKTFRTKVEANQYAAKIQTDVYNRDFIDPRAGNETVRDVSERWQATRSLDCITRKAVTARMTTTA